jgi:hypothetical protein
VALPRACGQYVSTGLRVDIRGFLIGVLLTPVWGVAVTSFTAAAVSSEMMLVVRILNDFLGLMTSLGEQKVISVKKLVFVGVEKLV